MKFAFNIFVILIFLKSPIIEGQVSVGGALSKMRSLNLTESQEITFLDSIYPNILENNKLDSCAIIDYYITRRAYKIGDYAKAIQHGKRGLNYFHKTSFSGYEYPNLLYYYSLACKELGHNDLAIALLKEAIIAPLSNRRYRLLGEIYRTLSQVYRQIGKYEEANTLLESFIFSSEFDNIPINHQKILILEAGKAKYLAFNNLELNEYFELLNKNINLKNTVLPYLTQLEGQSLFNQKLYREAYDKLNKSLNYSNRITNVNARDLFKVECLSNMLAALIEGKQIKKALKIKRQLDEKMHSSGHLMSISSKAMYYDNASCYYREIGLLDSALILIDYGIEYINNNIQSDKNIYAFSDLLTTLIYDKSKTLFLKNQNQEDPNNWAKLKKLILEYDSLAMTVISNNLLESSFLHLNKKYERGYNLGIKLAAKTNDRELFYKMSERKNGLFLLESTQENIKSLSKESIQLDSLYRELKSSEIKYRFENKSSTTITDSLLSKLKQDQLEIFNKLRGHRSTQLLSSTDLNTILEKECSSIISYQSTEDVLYGMILTEENYEIKEICSSLYIDSLINIYISKNYNAEKYDILLKTLYKILLEPFKIKRKNIKIIPNGNISKLSFESLKQNGKNDYLINNYNISYTTSLSLDNYWNSNKLDKTNLFSILSPIYDSTQVLNEGLSSYNSATKKDSLSYLHYTAMEVDKLSNSYESHLIRKNTISKNDFLNSMANSRILHFTGHAVLDPNSYEYAFLALGKDRADLQQIITLSEISNSKTTAELVYLNACDTGNGELIEGEGMLNLARSFFQAGAKSVINSLWSIDDQSSSIITISFYKYLKQGHTKSYALAQAKRDYLNSDIPEYKKHPYYWAGLILIGNDDPIELQNASGSHLWHLGSCSILLICLVLLFKRFKSIRTHH